MIKVFIDTNILLDYYLNRDGADAAEYCQLPLYTAEEFLATLKK